jgi:ABC-2 type transport system ATP-binding protein
LRISTLSPIAQVLAVLGARGVADGADAALADVRREEAPALIRALVEAGVEITEARWRDADLEGVYLKTLEAKGEI